MCDAVRRRSCDDSAADSCSFRIVRPTLSGCSEHSFIHSITVYCLPAHLHAARSYMQHAHASSCARVCRPTANKERFAQSSSSVTTKVAAATKESQLPPEHQWPPRCHGQHQTNQRQRAVPTGSQVGSIRTAAAPPAPGRSGSARNPAVHAAFSEVGRSSLQHKRPNSSSFIHSIRFTVFWEHLARPKAKARASTPKL